MVVTGEPDPVGPVPGARLDELEKGNGGELDPVGKVGGPVPVPLVGTMTVEFGRGKGALEGKVDRGGIPVPDTPVPDGAVHTPVELSAGNGGEDGKPVPPIDAELDTADPGGLGDVPVGTKPVDVGAVELESGNGSVDVLKGGPVADMNDSLLLVVDLVTATEERSTVRVKVKVVTVTLPLLSVNVLVAVPVMASTLDVSKIGVVDAELSGATELELVANGGPAVAAEVVPTAIDV